MNQQILFNDDMAFDDNSRTYCFTGLLAGERVTISIKTETPLLLNEALKFNFECHVEEWLEENEPPENGEITLFYK
ncbi:MAG: hypothetical protein HRT53_04355 [Colwellia sp.]|nr:hypothetical protein [Colwellia sp.]